MKNGGICEFSNHNHRFSVWVLVVPILQRSIYPKGEKTFPSPPETYKEGLILPHHLAKVFTPSAESAQKIKFFM